VPNLFSDEAPVQRHLVSVEIIIVSWENKKQVLVWNFFWVSAVYFERC